MIIKRKYVKIEILTDNDKYTQNAITNIFDSSDIDVKDCVSIFGMIKDKRLCELENGNIIKKSLYNALAEKFDYLDVFHPYNNYYFPKEVVTAEIIRKENNNLTIALVKPQTKYSPSEYVSVINLEFDKFGVYRLL